MSLINYIGQFLKEQGFEKTLNSLELEYGYPINTSIEGLPTNETLKEILSDRITFKSLAPPVRDVIFTHWQFPYPKVVKDEFDVGEVIVSMDIVSSRQWILVSTNKQKLLIVDFSGNVINTFDKLINVVIKKIVTADDNVYLGGMDGKVYRFEIQGIDLIKRNEVQLHRRVIIDMKVIKYQEQVFLVSLGFEKLIKLVRAEGLEIVTSFETNNYPKCFDIIGINNEIYALVGYAENTLLDMIQMTREPTRLYKVSISDAEFATTSFTPHFIQFKQTTEDIKIAIGTSHEPYMRVIIIKIDSWTQENVIKRNQILKNIVTMSPQDKFSNPYIQWRLKGDGIWVLGDDGIIRGINLVNEEILELTGHKGKVKYMLTSHDKHEYLVTAGDDRSLKIWH